MYEIKGEFLFKYGVKVEEKIIINTLEEFEEIKENIKRMKSFISSGFKNGIDMNVIFGEYIIRGSELIAVKFNVIENKKES